MTAASSGNLFVKEWTLLAKTGVENSLPYLAKARPKLQYLQHLFDSLEKSCCRANPAMDACFMDEDRFKRHVKTPQLQKHVWQVLIAKDYVKKVLCAQKVLHNNSASLTILQRGLINAKTFLDKRLA